MAVFLQQNPRALAALLIVYFVWGSTYLAIRIGVMDLPPALFAGVRFGLAGVLMLIYARLRGLAFPSGGDWRAVALTGLLLLVGGNGLVTWAEQWIESSQAALIIATSALWLAGLGALGPGAEPLGKLTIAGLLLGFAGVAILVGVGASYRLGPPLAYAALLGSPVLWASGSIYARRHPTQCAPAMMVAMQMLVGGAVLSAIGLANGEAARWVWSLRSAGILLYLALFGSCLAYGAYFWLVHQVPPSILGTYAYVNPAIAVLLGSWVLGEHLETPQIAGTAIILGAVVLVTAAARRPSTPAALRKAG